MKYLSIQLTPQFGFIRILLLKIRWRKFIMSQRTYIATIKVNGKVQEVTVEASNDHEAKRLIQAQYNPERFVGNPQHKQRS